MSEMLLVSLILILLGIFILLRNKYVLKAQLAAIDIIYESPDWETLQRILDDPSYDELVVHPKHWHKWTMKQMYPELLM